MEWSVDGNGTGTAHQRSARRLLQTATALMRDIHWLSGAAALDRLAEVDRVVARLELRIDLCRDEALADMGLDDDARVEAIERSAHAAYWDK